PLPRPTRLVVPAVRQILPSVYRTLTIPGDLGVIRGDCLGSGILTSMRIIGANATAQVASSSAPKRAAGSGFSVAEDEGPTGPAPAATLRTIGGIDALMALQGQEDLPERRRRAVKHGRVALDALDELKVEVLGGTLGPSTLMRLKSATADLRDASGDAGLD